MEKKTPLHYCWLLSGHQSLEKATLNVRSFLQIYIDVFFKHPFADSDLCVPQDAGSSVVFLNQEVAQVYGA